MSQVFVATELALGREVVTMPDRAREFHHHFIARSRSVFTHPTARPLGVDSARRAALRRRSFRET